MGFFLGDTHPKSPRAQVLMLRAVLLSVPLLSSPLFIINSMGRTGLPPDWQDPRGYETLFNPALATEGATMVRAFVVGSAVILLLIRLRLPTDAAPTKRHLALHLAYWLSFITYALTFVHTAAGAGWGWMAYGVGTILFSVTMISVGRYGYDLSRHR
jgi:hypothetical protein